MTELEEEWIKEMFRPGAFFAIGLSLIIIGGILLAIGRSAFGVSAVSAREDQMGEADLNWDNRKKYHLHEEIGSISRLPGIGKWMVILGGLITIVGFLLAFPD